ncbi:MAG: porin [Neptuniibacter sp.]
MKNNKAKLLAAAVAMGMSVQASAAIELHNTDGTTFSVDGYFNAFYTVESNEVPALGVDEDQSRVRMGFLPNWIGFNVSKEIGDLKVGGRSSFWVSINDGHEQITETAIDVRQFYGTIDGDWGQVLIGKDFGIYGRSNIFNDGMLMGSGAPLDFAVDLVNNRPSGVTYGSIAVGYPYAAPVAQITYRSPVVNGFQLAVGVMDPESGEFTEVGQSADLSARFEAEATYSGEFDGGTFGAWLGLAAGESGSREVLSSTQNNVDLEGDQNGVAYGAYIGSGGFKLTVSGYDQEGISNITTGTAAGEDSEAEGYLVQAQYSTGKHRFLLGHSETEETVLTGNETEWDLDTIAYFYSVNDNLTLVAQYDELEIDTLQSETKLFAIGAAISY